MGAPVGSRIYKSTKSYTCSHCEEPIPPEAKYLRFWFERGERSAVCLVCALTVWNVDGTRRYQCEALTDFVKAMRERLTPAELTKVLEITVVATACVINDQHPAIDFMRQFALGLRRGTFEKIDEQRQQRRKQCH